MVHGDRRSTWPYPSQQNATEETGEMVFPNAERHFEFRQVRVATIVDDLHVESEVTEMRRIRFLTILLAVLMTTAAVSWGGVFVSVSFGPPVLPVYAQPLCPGPGYIWTPGYWAWDPN